jgi:hypothetical protein
VTWPEPTWDADPSSQPEPPRRPDETWQPDPTWDPDQELRAMLGFGWYDDPAAKESAEISDPVTGRGLVASGLLAALGGVLPWVHIPTKHVTLTGVELGWFTTACGLVIAFAGLVVMVRQGRIWVSLTALCLAVLCFVITLILVGSLDADEAQRYDVTPAQVSIEYGLPLTVLATAMSAVCACYALVHRSARQRRRRRPRG